MKVMGRNWVWKETELARVVEENREDAADISRAAQNGTIPGVYGGKAILLIWRGRRRQSAPRKTLPFPQRTEPRIQLTSEVLCTIRSKGELGYLGLGGRVRPVWTSHTSQS